MQHEVKKTAGTSMRLSSATHEALKEISSHEMNDASLGDVVATLVFEHQTRAAFRNMSDVDRDNYDAETDQLADIDVEVAP